jgi:hypothetical protein
MAPAGRGRFGGRLADVMAGPNRRDGEMVTTMRPPVASASSGASPSRYSAGSPLVQWTPRTALMEAGLRRPDSSGLPCYLETSDPAHEAFYRRLRFEVVEPRLEHIAGGPPYLAMRRAPRP